LAGERYTGDERSRVLRRALLDDDVGTRLWAARAALKNGLQFAEMEVDPCGAIRVWALRARVERGAAAAIPALRNALFDRAASVRASARFHLSRFEPHLNIAELYRRSLDEYVDGDSLTCAITGLAEVGNRDDAALIAFHTSAISVRVAKAAIRACGRLARADCARELVEALSDSRVGVSKSARLALADAPLAPGLLAGLVHDALYTHTRLNALALFGNLERWERLIELLKAIANDREEVRRAAHHAVQRWLTTLWQSSHLPAPPRPEQRDQLRKLMGTVSDASLRGRLEQALSG
jgi:HEAT repeat protein